MSNTQTPVYANWETLVPYASDSMPNLVAMHRKHLESIDQEMLAIRADNIAELLQDYFWQRTLTIVRSADKQELTSLLGHMTDSEEENSSKAVVDI